MAATATSNEVLFHCPGCGREVMGTFALEMELGKVSDGKVEATGKVVGVRVKHDCIPQKVRGDG